jgi:dynein heavy chain
MTLTKLLELNLHKYEDEVKTIVDKSVKEMSMEKSLKEFTEIWANMEFKYESHPCLNIKLLKCTEDVIEKLEDNQVPNRRRNILSVALYSFIKRQEFYIF